MAGDCRIGYKQAIRDVIDDVLLKECYIHLYALSVGLQLSTPEFYRQYVSIRHSRP